MPDSAGIIRILVVSGVALLTAGCVIHKEVDFPDGAHILSIDARQRQILSTSVPAKYIEKDGTIKLDAEAKVHRFCAEPPPDVFSALAGSLAASVDTALTGTTVQKLGGKLSAAFSENAATIERTQVINAVRESMYRTCERFMNGAISREELIIQAARDQRTMVQLLAIEQLTGVYRGRATALTTLAKAATAGLGEDSLKILDAARSRKEDLQKRLAAADLSGDCSKLPGDASAEKKAQCATTEKLRGELAEASAYYAKVEAVFEQQAGVSASASGALSEYVKSDVSAPNSEVASTVLGIVEKNSEFNELQMACVAQLRTPDNQLAGICMLVLEDMVRIGAILQEKDAIESLNKMDEVLEAYRGKKINLDSAADALWGYLSVGNSVSEAKLNELLKRSGVPLIAPIRKMILQAKNKATLADALISISEKKRIALANAVLK